MKNRGVRRGLGPAVLLLTRFAAGELSAQVTTGTIAGAVLHRGGGPIGGARVTVRSPRSVAGETAVTTNERGTFRFPTLTPGGYELTVERPGFESCREEGIQLLAGRTIERRVYLPLVRAEEVFVDVERVERNVVESTVYENQLVQNLRDGAPTPVTAKRARGGRLLRSKRGGGIQSQRAAGG